MEQKIAVVTGANKGIGFAIAKGLGHQGMKVIAAARDMTRGHEAERALKRDGVDALFLQLDVSDFESVERFPAQLKEAVGSVHVLVNNAAILLDAEAQALTVDLNKVRKTFETNVIGALHISQKLIPFMLEQRYGRIVNLSSGLGALSEMAGGYPGYRISKTALNAVTLMLAAETKQNNILVNSMCPGWVRTDMGGPHAHRSPEEGADTAIFLATLPDDGPTGGFFPKPRADPVVNNRRSYQQLSFTQGLITNSPSTARAMASLSIGRQSLFDR